MSLARRLFDGFNRTLFGAPPPIRALAARAISYAPFVLARPSVFMVEPTNVCNGTCSLCPVGVDIDKRPKGFLAYETLVRLVDEIRPYAKCVIMNFAGEPLLHRRIGDLISYAETNGIPVIVGTSGTIDKSEELIASGVSELLFSLDGATPETYHRYRNYRNGTRFETVVENLRRLVEAKKRSGSAKPRIILQFVVFRHNEHETEDIVSLGRRIGVDAVDLKPVCLNDFFGESLEDMIARYLPARQSHYLRRGDRMVLKKPPLCSFIFHETEILWNGDVTICCYDYDGAYVLGNILEEGGFEAVWKGEKYREMRRRIAKLEPDLCRRCGNTFEFGTRIRITPAEPS
jgi:radical SAM protein with 4Fe4S-binding SPASM domain